MKAGNFTGLCVVKRDVANGLAWHLDMRKSALSRLT
jgi:hypothetical protein